MSNDDDPGLYRVRVIVTDTEGHNVAAGEQFRHHFVSGDDRSRRVAHQHAVYN